MNAIRSLLFFGVLHLMLLSAGSAEASEASPRLPREAQAGVVYVIPIREDIAPPLTYLVRRAVKEAMEVKAPLIILDMETNGGRLDVTEEIIEILSKFPGKLVTYVNRKAFSAGAFIAVGTEDIYMAPQSVIGAAAPILMGPTGGAEDIPDTVRAKMTSGVKALIRTSAEKHGHNPEVIEAMIDSSKELKIDDEVINEKGQILTLTNLQAEKTYGESKEPLLSLGTVPSVEDLIKKLGFGSAAVVRVEASGAERLGFWLNKISPILLIIGILGVYLEMKTPGFGLPGITGAIAFGLYFLGGLIAGLTGVEWIVVFILGIGLVFLELFIIPGTFIAGLAGAAMILMGLAMAMVDLYPGMGNIPTIGQIQKPLQNVLISFTTAVVLILFLGKYMVSSPVFRRMTSAQGSGVASVAIQENRLSRFEGCEGVALSPLRPGGKVKVGEDIVDALTQGDFIDKGAKVRVIGKTGSEVVVEPFSA
ncbi:MAG: NfeD family protein [Verrucomicrobiales bacterium]